MAAINYVSELSRNFSGLRNEIDPASMDSYKGRRRHLKQAMTLVAAYERALFAEMISGMQAIEGVRIYGITDSNRLAERCPTLAFTISIDINCHLLYGNLQINVYKSTIKCINKYK